MGPGSPTCGSTGRKDALFSVTGTPLPRLRAPIAVTPTDLFSPVSHPAKTGGRRRACARWQLVEELRDGLQLRLEGVEV
jgi:hypothetical protein